MKNTLPVLFTVMMIFTLAACGNTSNSISESTNVPDNIPETTAPESHETAVSSENEDTQSDGGEPDDTNILIAYFSRAGENYNVGVIEKGNIEIVAEMIAEQTGGNLFHIETVTSYPESYRECTDVAQQELRDNARPKLTANVEDFDSYDVVFLGYPKLEYGFNCVSCVLSGIFKSDRTVYTGICALCVCCLHR